MPQTPIYLDHHATTPVDPRVLDAMLPYFTEQFGNAASTSHCFGETARNAVESARAEVARFVNTDPECVIFTSGATEANNLAIKGFFQAALRKQSPGPKPHLIVNAAEHRAVLDPAKRLKRLGADVSVLPVDEHAQVHPESVETAIQPGSRLASTMLVNNEVGTINPVHRIADVCRKSGVLLHCDAVQAAGRIPVNFPQLGADLLTLTAHKFYGPKGVGALIVRRDGDRIPLEPLIDGGGHEGQLRSGTLPVPLIVGFGEACRIAREELECDKSSDGFDSGPLAQMCDKLWKQLSSRLDGIYLNGHPIERVPANLNVSFDGIDGDVLMNAMTEIAVSSGSACTSANPQPSHVLIAMGRSDQLTRASLRFGIGRFNTMDEIEFAANYVIEAVQRLRG